MALTLSLDEFVSDVLDAFKVRVPFIGNFSTDFSSATAKLGDTITGRIDLIPTVRGYDATTGYKANAAEASALQADVPVVLNTHSHVPTKVDYIDDISSKVDLYRAAIGERGFALGKAVVDAAAALWVAANHSQQSIFSTANSDLDMLIDVGSDMNIIGANPMGRIGIVNSAVMATLMADSRIASKDYYGQLGREMGGLGVIRGVAGFEAIYEWPSLPGNAENLTGFFCTKEAVILAARVPSKITAPSAAMQNIAQTATAQDENTGLTFGAIEWCEAGTFDDYMTIAVLYGVKAGKQAGSAGAITDYAGHRLVTA